jgi:tRNA A-37 threonylcarbamoyl transferase component Bud32
LSTDIEFDAESLAGGPPVSPEPTSSERGAELRRARWLEERRVIGKIGRYTVLGQIAGGGMGSVFVAQMRGPAAFSRLVAIKCLHTRWLDDPKYVARFTTEVKLSTLIRHPNVVQTLDVVADSGELFLVMEYVDGVTLAALLADLARARQTLPVAVALGILSAVLRGLHAAHDAVDHDGVPCHIVHRDVSPQNIMLGRNGHVQVLDFGAAKADEHSQHTAAGVLVGKLAYMAPEQVRGERSGPRTDVFSAGVVLWESLVGQRLFYEPGLDRSDLLHALVLKPVPRPSRLRADVPRAVDDVVKRALSRDPKRRYQTALEFADALDSIGAAPPGAALATLVAELCAERLAEKDALLRAGLATAAEASEATPVARAQLVASPPSFSGMALSSLPQPLRRSRLAWLGAALLAGLALWWTVDTAQTPRRGRSMSALDVGSATAPSAAAADSVSAPRDVTSPRVVTEPEELAAAPFVVSSLAVAPPARAESASGERERSHRRADRGRTDRGREAKAKQKLRRGRAQPHSSAAAPEVSTRDCDPPTYMDAAGIRHFKKDCL